MDREEIDERRDALGHEHRVAVVAGEVAAHVDGRGRPGRSPAELGELAAHHARHVVLQELAPVGVEVRRLGARAVAHEDVLIGLLRVVADVVEMRRLHVVPVGVRLRDAPHPIGRLDRAVLLPRPRAEVAADAPVGGIRPRFAGDLHVGRQGIGLQVVVDRATMRKREREAAVGSGIPAEVMAHVVVDLVKLGVVEREPVGLGGEGLPTRAGLVAVEEVGEEPEPRRLAPPGDDADVGLVPHDHGALRLLPRGDERTVVERDGVNPLQPREPDAEVSLLRCGVAVAVAHPVVRAALLVHHAVPEFEPDRRKRLHGRKGNGRVRRFHAEVREDRGRKAQGKTSRSEGFHGR